MMVIYFESYTQFCSGKFSIFHHSITTFLRPRILTSEMLRFHLRRVFTSRVREDLVFDVKWAVLSFQLKAKNFGICPLEIG